VGRVDLGQRPGLTVYVSRWYCLAVGLIRFGGLMDKAISIKCKAAAYVPMADLNKFQGDLKTITTEKFNDLKQSVIKHGLPLSFSVWVDKKGKNWIIDGTHRRLVLQALESEGYFIPPLPVNFVEADSKKEAARIVLISNSRYAKINDASLSDFMIENELNIDDLQHLDIPELDMSAFDMTGGDEQTDDQEKPPSESRHFVEIQCADETQKTEIYTELVDRGFIVRIK